MKSFMKLIITLLVMGVLGFCVVYLLMNDPKEPEVTVQPSGEKIENVEIQIVTSGEHMVENTVVSGESGEKEEVYTETKEEKVQKIDAYANAEKSGEIVKELSEKFPEELLTEKAHDVMQYFDQANLSVNVRVWENAIEVLPAPDFIENMFYLFDEDGNLMLYESTSTTVGGSSKYYFENGKLIEVVNGYQEEIAFEPESTNSILIRASQLREKYLVSPIEETIVPSVNEDLF